MTPRDRVGGPSGRRDGAVDRCIVKPFRRPPAGRIRDLQGGLPIGGSADRLSDSLASASRCTASPQRTLLAENLGKPSLGVIINVLWYYLQLLAISI